MNPLTGARRLSAVTFHTVEKGQSHAFRAPPLGARFYQSRPSLSEASVQAPPKMVNDFLKKHELSHIAASFGFTYPGISSNRDTWMAAVMEVNASSVKPPLCEMTGEQALALLLTLSKAGHACGADMDSPEFAVLSLNLHALGQLSFPASDRSKLGQFARSSLQALAIHMPSCGMDFVNMPPQDRRMALNGFTRQMLTNAFELGTGPREEDMGALSGITFDPQVNLGAGGFGVNRSAQPELLLSERLLSNDLSRTVEDIASDNAMSPAQFANRLLVQHVTTIEHELVHASQYSALSGNPEDPGQFARLQANRYSFATEELVMGRSPQYQDPENQFIFYLHEMSAWYTTGMGCAAISQSPKMDEGMRQEARALISNSRNSRMMDELLGHERRGFATLEEEFGSVKLTSQRRVDKPEEYLRATPARLEAELDKVAPLS